MFYRHSSRRFLALRSALVTVVLVVGGLAAFANVANAADVECKSDGTVTTPNGARYRAALCELSDRTVFKEPSAQSAEVGEATTGFTRFVCGISQNGGWLYTRASGTDGWGWVPASSVEGVEKGDVLSGVADCAKDALGKKKVAVPKSAKVSKGTAEGRAAVAAAQEWLDTPYQWGGESKSGTDCSGLTMSAWKKAGKTIPRVSRDQFKKLKDDGKELKSQNELQPGDLIFYSSGGGDYITHVTMALSNKRMIEAASSAGKVHETEIRTDKVVGYARP